MSLLAKRKIDELDDSDEEEPSLGRQVLPVANLPDTFDGVPTDGLQYLFTVRRDARLLPHVTRAPNPYEAPEPAAAAPLPGPSQTKARTDVLPSEEWQEMFLKRFKNFRKNSVQPTIHVHIPDPSSKPIPDKKERDLWWMYLAGHPESEWNPPKKPKQPKPSRWQQRNLKKGKPLPVFADDLHEDASLSYDAPDGESLGAGPSNVSFEMESELSTFGSAVQLLPTPSGTPAPPDLSADVSMEEVSGAGKGPTAYVPREPTPTLMQHIDHKYAIHLLMYFTHWINLRVEPSSFPLTDITQSHARWMFALLSRVDDWISGDETSLLRNLARACISLVAERRRRRVSLGESEAGEVSEEANMIDDASCWMIVCAVTGFWGQRDLWMDAEALLSKVEEGTAA
ncbi:hypothetical protein C8Q79DRAFT_900011 [Trametes meyenii]|nr:hypothetical protein C8Q79DRAFT_900011 [Trametes meyenii]